ncbi:MAG: chromate transporter [Angelakisella sp.]
MIFLRLFWEFFKTGLFSIGGGLATLPFLYDMSASTGWFTELQLADMVAVSESTPGPIGVNMATYVGYTTAGIPGSLIAVFGLVLPSVIIILLIARFLSSFSQQPQVRSAFYGLRPASVALIAVAALSVVKISIINVDALGGGAALSQLINRKSLLLAAVLWVLMEKKKLHPIVIIAIAALTGIVFRFAGV